MEELTAPILGLVLGLLCRRVFRGPVRRLSFVAAALAAGIAAAALAGELAEAWFYLCFDVATAALGIAAAALLDQLGTSLIPGPWRRVAIRSEPRRNPDT